VLRAVLDELKRRDLPFIDAHLGPSMVEEIGEETGADLPDRRSLDTTRHRGFRAPRIKEIVAAACKRLDRGHGAPQRARPRRAGIGAARIKAQGVELVPISRVAI